MTDRVWQRVLEFVIAERDALLFSADTSADYQEVEEWNALIRWVESEIESSDSES